MRLPATALLLLALLAGCTGATGGSAREVVTPSSNVDVATAELRQQKKQAGVEPCKPTDAPPLDHEDALPPIALPCLGGGPTIDLNKLRGPLVINLFAQWCEPCREELPYYQRLHEESPGGVRVLGIDYLDTQPAGALELAEKAGVTFPLLADPSGELRPVFRIRALPGVILVDAQGRIAHHDFTVIDSYAELTQLVEQHLDVSA